nr:hypothetical protein [Vibrio neonatus]
MIDNYSIILLLITNLVISGEWMLFSEMIKSIFICSIFGSLLFSMRFWAGGDSKLIIALAPLFPFYLLDEILYLIILFGGILSLIYWIKYRLIFIEKKDRGVPYGVAILAGSNIYLYGILSGLIIV